MAQSRTGGHTVAKRPWSIVVSVGFPTEKEAVRFENSLDMRLVGPIPMRRRTQSTIRPSALPRESTCDSSLHGIGIPVRPIVRVHG